MRGSRRILALVALLSAVLIGSVVFASGLVPNFTLNSPPPAAVLPTQGGSATVAIVPDLVVGDWEYDPEYNIGEWFTVDVNVTVPSGEDLFAWQVNVTWDPAILAVNDLTAGEFLKRSSSPTASEELTAYYGVPVMVNDTDNVAGYCATAETIAADVAGIAGPDTGTLVTINFTILEYGWTEIIIGDSPETLLLNSTPGAPPIDFDKVNGWFDNRITGDSDSDGVVTIADMGEVSDNWASTTAPYVDWDYDDVITISDMGTVSDNWARVRT